MNFLFFKRTGLALVLCLMAFQLAANPKDSLVIRKLFDEALEHGRAYERLRELCKNIGGRLSGSPEADAAVIWAKSVMETYRFDKVWLQKIMVPKWERGDVENAKIEQLDLDLNICALGGSVGTNGIIRGDLIEVKTMDELEQLGSDQLMGKIVFFNRAMDPKLIDSFNAYGGCVNQRVVGASKAAKYGAVAALVRSMAYEADEHPHTGVLDYAEDMPKIPAAAISAAQADQLSDLIKKHKTLEVQVEMNCRSLPDVPSYNVIGEITGATDPEKVILVGGHLDSWDLGEGAHDDGAGVVQSMEVLRIFKMAGVKPKCTIRCVLFMNEENGNRGGKAYAKYVKEKNEEHLAAIESDRGGFTPRGFSIDATANQIKTIQNWESQLRPYNLHIFEKGYGGVDIGPLRNGSTALIGLVPDPQRYFDYHHSAMDVFETVNRRELEMGAASMAALVYLIDKYGLPKEIMD